MDLLSRKNTFISKIEITLCECTKNLSVETYHSVLECHCLVTLLFMLFYYQFGFMSSFLSRECWSSTDVCNFAVYVFLLQLSMFHYKNKDPKILSLALFMWRFRYPILIRSNGNCAEKAMHSSSLYRGCMEDVGFSSWDVIEYKGLKPLCLPQYFNSMITALLDIWTREPSVSLI